MVWTSFQLLLATFREMFGNPTPNITTKTSKGKKNVVTTLGKKRAARRLVLGGISCGNSRVLREEQLLEVWRGIGTVLFLPL